MWKTEDDIQQMLRESAEAWSADHGGPERFRAFHAGATGFDPDQWGQMAELGWTGLLLPEEAGGSGLGLGPGLTLAEVFGAGLIAAPFVPAALVAGSVLAGLPHHPLASALAEGRAAPVMATGAGHSGLRFTAGRITGSLAFVAGWHPDASLLVPALAEGVVIALVAPQAEGMAAQPVQMADGTLAAGLAFTGTPADRLLSGPAAEEALARAGCHEALGLSAMLEGMGRALFGMTAEYVRQRVQFDRPLASFQVLRHTLVDLHAQMELAAASWRIAARLLEAEGPRAAAARVAMARARAGSAAHAMGKAAIEYHGAFGYTDEADIGLYANAILRLAAQGGGAILHRRDALRHARPRPAQQETAHVPA